jgi:hypothetical protein
MADTWKCSACYRTLRCSCNSMECSFDYDIQAHVRADLKRAIELAAQWYELQPREIAVFTNRIIKEINNG